MAEVKAFDSNRLSTPEATFLKRSYGMLLVTLMLTGSIKGAASGIEPDQPEQPVLVQPLDNSINISTSPILQVTVSDPDPSDKLDVNFYGRIKSTGSGEDFTFVFIPDPQNESQFYSAAFTSMTDWIVAQRSARNIVFVTTAGDMVNNASSTAEYINADAAMDKLDPAGIPYSVGLGNHDMPSTLFNTYFGISRFSGKSWTGGHYGSNNDNSYSLFTASGMDFILINLAYNPSTAVLDWADALLKANSGRRAIVESHSILNIDNSWTNQSVFTALKDNPNLFLMLCGHMHDSDDGAAYRSELGDDGHTIHIMLADYQDYPSGGNGNLRILRFSPAADMIYATTYSPFTGSSITTYPDQMEMAYDMENGSAGAYTLIGTVNNVDNGASASVTWPGRLTSTSYEWYATASDGSGTVTGATWTFTTTATVCVPPNVPVAGDITQPSCALATGRVVLSGLPSGSWIINPGAITGSGTSTTLTGLISGTYNFTVTTTPNCTSDPTPNVVIDPQPLIPARPGTITGNNTVCQGVSGTYSIASVPGATSYTWTLPSGWSGSSTSTSITATAGASGGNISVTANNACGNSTARSLNITGQTIPAQPGSISGNTTVCQGESQTFSISAVSAATSYTWTLPSGWSGSSGSTSINATAGADGGTITVMANNSCGSGTPRNLNVMVQTIPAQPGAIAGNTAVCQGVSETYSITAVSGATSYTWTLPAGWSGSSGTTSITATPGSNSGNISVTANNSCGSGTARTLSVTVTALPARPGTITGNNTVCQGVSQTYSIASVPGATSFTWTLPSGWSGSSTSTSITATAGATGGNISVTANNACGNSTARSLNITGQTIPAQPGSISGNTTVCQGESQTFSISAVSGATSYTWTLPSGWSGSSGSTSINAIAGADGGTITVMANNSCGTGIPRTLNVMVQTTPAQPGSIAGNTAICQGVSQTYSITAVNGAASYTWTLPSGWSGSSGTTSITATPGANSGNISVSANNSCGSSQSRLLSISVTSIPPQPGAISGNATVCQGVSQTYSIASVPGATSYTWSIPSGWGGSSGSTTITVNPGAASGNISVTANNSCGSGSPRILSVSAAAIPAQPGAITGNTTVCQGATQTYSLSAVSGATSYTWTLPSGWSGSSGSTSINVTSGPDGGIISVTANNECGSSAARSLNVTVHTIPSQPGAISGTTGVCQGVSQIYSITAVDDATSYTWTLPPGWSGSSGTTLITATAGANSGNISVTANNSCGSGVSRQLSVSVTSIPPQPGAITGDNTVCQGVSQTYSITAVSGATSYTWTLPSGWSGSSGSNSITATAGATGGNISVTGNNFCGNSATRSLNVGVQTVPVQPGTIDGNVVVCQGATQTYSIAAVAGAAFYTWTLPSGWSGSSGSTSINAIAGADGGTITVMANNSCGTGIPRTLNVMVQTTPAQPGSIAGNTAICQGVSQTYSITAVNGAASYTWTLPSGWSGSSGTTSITATPGSNSGNITVRANNSCGSGGSRLLSVSVASIPVQPGAITGNATVCQGVSQTYSIASVPGATSYTWTLPSGWSGSSGSNSITATAGATGGNISVTGNNFCGNSIARTLNVVVHTVPLQPGAIEGNAVVCQGAAQTYSIVAVPDATSFTWTLPSGWSGNSDSTSINATAGVEGGIISVLANNFCGSGPPQTEEVNIPVVPTVKTLSVKGISYSTADVVSDLISDGGVNITERGICWSFSVNPTITDSRTSDETSTGSFTSTIPGLSTGVLYHIRPYATNCSGTGYGSDIKYLHIPTGIDIISNEGICVFPNPVSGILNIEYNNDNFKTVRIINSSGVLMGHEKAVIPRQQLDFSKFEYGIYILEFIRPSGEICRVKVIKAK